MNKTRRFLVLLVAALACAAIATPASAAPGAYRVLVAEPYAVGAHALGAQIAAFPDVAAVEFANTGTEGGTTPSAAQLEPYDVVVSIGDSTYEDPVAWGESLAAFVDGGGVVVQSAYDTWDSDQSFPGGRFSAEGYAPFVPGPNENEATVLGSFDPADPLMEGIASLSTAHLNTTNEVAPGARLVASWADGRPAIAAKGRVVAVTAWIGDEYGPGMWTGDYGRLVLNAVRTLGPPAPAPPAHERPALTVLNANPAGGTVTASAGGLSCGAVCTAIFDRGAAVSLGAEANRGFAFAGFSGACAGTACALTMDSAKTVGASFSAFRAVGKLKRNLAKGTARLSIRVGAPGTLRLSGRKVKKRSKAVAAPRTVNLPILAKGRAMKRLRDTGRSRVRLNVVYRPAGGAASTLTRTVVLKLAR